MYRVHELTERYLQMESEIEPTSSKTELKAHHVLKQKVYEDDKPSKVDVVGYVDPNRRIKQMEEAGLRIDAWQHAVYDFENEDQDDGIMMAAERDDWDDLDMLSDGAREKELYRREMYKLYLNALNNEKMAQSGLREPGEENKKQSVKEDLKQKAEDSLLD